MFLLEIAIGVFSYVLAKSIWDFVKVRAQACGQYPLVWLLQTTGLLLVLVGLVGGGLTFIFGAVWFILTHQK
jgi:hypothetical protein